MHLRRMILFCFLLHFFKCRVQVTCLGSGDAPFLQGGGADRAGTEVVLGEPEGPGQHEIIYFQNTDKTAKKGRHLSLSLTGKRGLKALQRTKER